MEKGRSCSYSKYRLQSLKRADRLRFIWAQQASLVGNPSIAFERVFELTFRMVNRPPLTNTHVEILTPLLVLTRLRPVTVELTIFQPLLKQEMTHPQFDGRVKSAVHLTWRRGAHLARVVSSHWGVSVCSLFDWVDAQHEITQLWISSLVPTRMTRRSQC